MSGKAEKFLKNSALVEWKKTHFIAAHYWNFIGNLKVEKKSLVHHGAKSKCFLQNESNERVMKH